MTGFRGSVVPRFSRKGLFIFRFTVLDIGTKTSVGSCISGARHRTTPAARIRSSAVVLPVEMPTCGKWSGLFWDVLLTDRGHTRDSRVSSCGPSPKGRSAFAGYREYQAGMQSLVRVFGNGQQVSSVKKTPVSFSGIGFPGEHISMTDPHSALRIQFC